MPRLQTTETGMTWSVPTRMGDTGSRWRRGLDVDQRTSVYAVFSWSRLERIHLAKSAMQVDMLFWSSSVADGRQSPWVSSAYRWGKRPWPSIRRSKSAVYNENRIGPRTDPCGTPHRISARDEVERALPHELVSRWQPDSSHAEGAELGHLDMVAESLGQSKRNFLKSLSPPHLHCKSEVP